MAVRIPFIEQRIATPDAELRGGRLNAPEADGIGQGLQNLGNAVTNYALTKKALDEKRKAEQERQAEEDAKAFAVKAVPQMSLDLSKIETDTQTTAPPGAAGYFDNVQKQVDGYLTEAEKNAPTPQSKKYIAEHGASMRAQLLGRAYAWQSNERRAQRVSDFETGNATAAQVVGRDSSQFRVMHDQQGALIDALDAPPEVKRKLKEANDRNLATAAVLGDAERDPAGTEAKLRAKLGMSGAAFEQPITPGMLEAAKKMVYTGDGAEEFNALSDEDKARLAWATQQGTADFDVKDGKLVPKASPAGAAYDLLDTQQAVTLLGRVQAEGARQDQGFRTYVTGRVQDDNAAALDGKPTPAPLTAADFTRAYGETGPQAFAEYQAKQATAKVLPSLATLPPEKLVATVKAAEPSPGEGYIGAHQNYIALAQAAAQVVKQRFGDPVAFAMAHNLGNVQPLSLGQPDAADQLRARQASGTAMADQYGVPMRILSNNDAKQLSEWLASLPPEQKLAVLHTFRTPLNDAGFRSVLDQLAKDQPEIADAAAYLTVVGASVHTSAGDVAAVNVAKTLLAGQALLNPPPGGTKVVIKADAELRQMFNEVVGSAYGRQAVMEEKAFQAFRAYYAQTAAGKLNDPQADPMIATAAIEAVTGGIAEVNGSKVVLPWGVSEDAFIDQARRIWPQFAEMAGISPTTPFAGVTFTPKGGDSYYVMAGDGPLPNAKNGAPLVMVIGRPAAGATATEFRYSKYSAADRPGRE